MKKLLSVLIVVFQALTWFQLWCFVCHPCKDHLNSTKGTPPIKKNVFFRALPKLPVKPNAALNSSVEYPTLNQSLTMRQLDQANESSDTTVAVNSDPGHSGSQISFQKQT